MDKYDVVIIGGGPIGLACGVESKKAGLTYLILEKGCLVNSLYHYPYNMTFFSTSEKLEIGGVPFISHNNKPTRSEALEYYRRVVLFWELNVCLYETVERIDNDHTFQITTNKGEYVAENVILSTGFYDLPFLLNIEGEHLSKVKHYYDEPHPYFGQKIIVVGAANSAVDVALETFRKGAEVTMVIREPEINSRVKYWVRPDIENRIKESSIMVYFNSNITQIRENEVDVTTPQGSLTIENDFVLAMTGYQPNFTFLESVGIKIGADEMKTPAHNPETMETNVPNIFLAGVICGGLQTNKWFIENSRAHAEIIVKKILGKRV
ncbi:MAG: YpdA family putative bacillithiol disulfide reductase [Cyclobacteriaceae bacterium]|jgi:thioredoxin reductase (NADPH)|nr:YpdA family putative bacillithiol disulfide reductase [Cyclobacteriaceae bacterium]